MENQPRKDGRNGSTDAGQRQQAKTPGSQGPARVATQADGSEAAPAVQDGPHAPTTSGTSTHEVDGAMDPIDVDLEVEADSPEEIAEFLEKARQALLAEGFRATPFQYRKKGQAFGLIKDHGHELQLHVRAFTNGIIESEVELSNRYIEHLVSPRRSAHAEIKAIFEKHDVPTKTINEEFRTRTGADRIAMPRTRTRRSVASAGAALAGAVAYAWFARRGRGDKRR